MFLPSGAAFPALHSTRFSFPLAAREILILPAGRYWAGEFD
jgi:hypothetical protein